MSRFTKVLIANRGEIAARIVRAAKSKGYRTVAVYSEADGAAPHVGLADQAVLIGPPSVGESYLSIDRIIDAARRTGAHAVHPGYGFLSENADFAKACADAGLVFIGPPADAIALMGNKAAAKRRMLDAGVPCVPGYQGTDQDDATLTAEAAKIGFPVMVKAAAGGGGRGMRLVADEAALQKALKGARSEAKNAFGSDELILEKAIVEPRHVEIQVVADERGEVVHLFERDCSVQRRHQKVIEEAPCPVLAAETRAYMGDAAVRAAQSIGYVGAGTVEFLLDAHGNFYFLEMNTRLQVEHPVTELVTGVDLVALQFDIAEGYPLPFHQKDLRIDGHAIEARLYAEDATRGFLPQTGRLLAFMPAEGVGVRIDHGMHEGMEVTPYYDPMLAKVIAWGQNRDEARRRLIAALHDTTVLGVTTNKGFLAEIVAHEAFAGGEATTAFIDEHFEGGKRKPGPPPGRVAAAAAFILAQGRDGGGWRTTGGATVPVLLKTRDDEIAARVVVDGADSTVTVGDATLGVSPVVQEGHIVRLLIDGVQESVRVAIAGNVLHMEVDGRVYRFEDATLAPAQAMAGADGRLVAPMAGKIIAVNAEAGAKVKKGDVLAVLEAMKMEHEVTAPIAGTVETVDAAIGDQVSARQLLVTIATPE